MFKETDAKSTLLISYNAIQKVKTVYMLQLSINKKK